MRSAWVCFWFALGAVEIGLTLWSHSATFLEIGAAVPVMIAYNLLRARSGAHTTVHLSLDEVTQPTPVIG